MRFDTLFIDLDGTLYENDNGLWIAIRDRMSQYLHERLGFSLEEVSSLRQYYYQTYGTTLRGLQIHHQVDADDYLAYVHDLPLENYIQPDPELHTLLSNLPQKKYIFTNADSGHATRVMTALGIEGCFDAIIDIRSLDFYCKPEVQAYRKALDIAAALQPEKCIFIDDTPNNLQPAIQMGMYTILVSKTNSEVCVDRTISNIKDLPIAAPELWEEA